MVADCFQCGSELDRCASSHGKLSSFLFFLLSWLHVSMPWIETGWLANGFLH